MYIIHPMCVNVHVSYELIYQYYFQLSRKMLQVPSAQTAQSQWVKLMMHRHNVSKSVHTVCII